MERSRKALLKESGGVQMRKCEMCPIRATEFCHRVNPKAKKYTASEKQAIREELDRKEKEKK
jgi:hypothetical protein